MNITEKKHFTRENAMRRALENGDFILHYQPQVCLISGKIMGAEALLRWQHPTEGIIPPLEFLPLAEETGLILPLGEWVMYEACRQTKHWLDQGLPPVSIGVNIAHAQFTQIKLPKLVEKVLSKTGLPAHQLDLELTEGILMKESHRPADIINQLKYTGITLSIDDFGTGYSSLSHLKDFTIDTLKIDQSFIKNLSTNSNDAALVTAILQMGRSLNMNVIAEGVEKNQQITFLRDLGCQSYQGFYFSPPILAEKFEELLSIQMPEKKINSA